MVEQNSENPNAAHPGESYATAEQAESEAIRARANAAESEAKAVEIEAKVAELKNSHAAAPFQRHRMNKIKSTEAKADIARREAIEAWQVSAAAWELAAEHWQQTNGKYEKLARAWEQAAEAWKYATEKAPAPSPETSSGKYKQAEAWQDAAKAWKKAAVEKEEDVSELTKTINSENPTIAGRVKKIQHTPS